MRALGLAFAIAAGSGCATSSLPAPLPQDVFAADLAVPVVDFPVRVLTQGEELIGLGVPLAMESRSWPAAVSRTVDAVQPGGEIRWSGRMRGPRGEGYLVESSFPASAQDTAAATAPAGTGAETPPQDIRSLWVDANGKVLERTHTIPPAQAPESILAAAAQALGTATVVERVDVVWGPVLEEGFRVTLRDEDGQPWIVRTDLEGDVFGLAQVRSATVTAWRP